VYGPAVSWWCRLAALFLVVGAVVWPDLASAATGVQLETRVGGIELVVHALVGGSSARSPEKHLGSSLAYDEIAPGYSLAAEGATYAEGSFSVIDWTGYPEGMPRPDGALRVLSGDEYAAARALANETNAGIRAANGLEGSGLQIHEIQPVKFGGSPTDMANKMLLPTAEHIGPDGVHPQFWQPLLQWVTGGGG